MEVEPQKTISDYFADYPSVIKGLKKLKLEHPTDFQEQLFEIEETPENLIVSAPTESGKTIAIILCALKKFINDEEGTLIFLAHSKDLSQTLTHLVTSFTRIPVTNLFMQELKDASAKKIIIGSPLQANAITKKEKDTVSSVVIIEADYLFGFGYGEALEILAGSLQAKTTYKISCIQKSAEIERFKSNWMKKVVKIEYLPAQAEHQTKKQKGEGQLTHFYCVGEKIMLPISLYVTLKFGLVNPKVLVICENLREVYRYALLLERCRVSGVGLYNHENPIDLKFYTISLWMNGAAGVLLATRQIVEDLTGPLFKQNCRRSLKRNQFDLINLTTIVCLNLHHLQESRDKLFNLFPNKPFLMTFLENRQEQIEELQSLIKFETVTYAQVSSRQLPISKAQLEGFRYRISDVFSTLNNHKVDLFQQLDFKKKMLKSPDLKEHFQQNQKERILLIKAVNELRKKLDHDKITISELVPDYLVPECLRPAYEEKLKAIHKHLKDEQVPDHHLKVRRVLKYIDTEEENPDTTDVSRLKLVSSRKRWKLQHGFKLKKRNLRNEKKGIFETS